MKKSILKLAAVTMSLSMLSSEIFAATGSSTTKRPVPIKRTNSQIFFQPSAIASGQVRTQKEELSKFLEANKIKGKEKILKNMQESEDRAVIRLLNVGSKLGFKRITLNNGKTLELLDISWPTIEEYAKKVIADAVLPERGNVENENETLNLKDLEEIITIIGEVKPMIDESGQEDRTKPFLSDEQIQQMIKFCVGKKRLFYCSQDIEKDFINLLETTLKNYTGFQRVASMLVISILNSIKEQAVIQGCTSWRIERVDAANACCYESLAVIKVPLNNNSENAVTFIHEAGHAYNTMLFGQVDDSMNADNVSIVVHSIANSPDSNFVDIFFPGLTRSVFESYVKSIDEFLKKNGLDNLDEIRNDIKRHIDLGYDFRTRTGRIIYNTFKNLVLAGFGGILFDLSTDPSDYRFDSEKILTRNNLAKAIYIMSTYMRKAKKGDAYSWSSSGTDFFKFEDDETAETAWDGTDEMLAMIGIVPYVIGGKTFVIHNKQNEFIAKKRTLADKEYTSEAELSVFRYHDPDYAKKFTQRLSVMLSEITMRPVDKVEFIEFVAFPKEMMHTTNEIINDGMKFEKSTKAIDVLKAKNATIANPELYIVDDYSSEATNYAVIQRDKEFKRQVVEAQKSLLSNKLLLAVMRRDINAIKELSADIDIGSEYIMLDKRLINETNLARFGSPDSSTLLHLAIANGDTEVIKCLLECIKSKSIDFNNLVDSSKMTPLCIAALTNNWEITKLLLESGAELRSHREWVDTMSRAAEKIKLIIKLSLSPIYECIDKTVTQSQVDEALEKIGVPISKEKIADLQQKLQSSKIITDADLDSILIETKSPIPEIRKRQQEWNGIGHIYYIEHFSKSSPDNTEYLNNKLKMSDLRKILLSPETLTNHGFKYVKTMEEYWNSMDIQTKILWFENLTPNFYQIIKSERVKKEIRDAICRVAYELRELVDEPENFEDNFARILHTLTDHQVIVIPSSVADFLTEPFSDYRKLNRKEIKECIEYSKKYYPRIIECLKTFRYKKFIHTALRLMPEVAKEYKKRYDIPQELIDNLKNFCSQNIS